MISAMKLFFQNYVNFSGRSRRREYWWAILGCGIVNAILSAVFVGSMTAYAMNSSGEPGTAGVVLIVSMALICIFNLAIFIPTLSVLIRRLHDIGKGGAWFFIALVPLVGSIILLVFLCTDSQPGPNQWGPNPKEYYAQG